jgi:Pyruvate/2-oxoacid:ferredoxin oxidoreductase delta subunit
MSRLESTCTRCGQTDTHPRHTTIDQATGVTASAHLDCCAGLGCGVCSRVLAAAPADARHGDALVGHLTEGTD